MFDPISVGAGFVIGAFTPSIGRKIKAIFVKEGTVAKAVVAKEATAVEATVTQAVASKL